MKKKTLQATFKQLKLLSDFGVFELEFGSDTDDVLHLIAQSF